MIHPERRRESIRQIAYEEGFHDGYAQALSEMPEIVRCKDCAMRCTYYNFCLMLRESVKDDFFCGWGKRKEGDGE